MASATLPNDAPSAQELKQAQHWCAQATIIAEHVDHLFDGVSQTSTTFAIRQLVSQMGWLCEMAAARLEGNADFRGAPEAWMLPPLTEEARRG